MPWKSMFLAPRVICFGEKEIRGSHDRDAWVKDIYGIIISGISTGFITFPTLFDYKNSSSMLLLTGVSIGCHCANKQFSYI